MIREVTLFGVLLVLPGGIHAQADHPALPDAVETELDARLPGWSLAPVSNEVAAYLGREDRERPPNLVVGDFDGDGGQDYALMVIHPVDPGRNQAVLAFLSRADGYEIHVLEELNPSTNSYLLKIEKGQEGYDYDREASFTYPTDAIMVWYIFGKNSAASYVYRQGGFVRVHSVD